MASHSFGSAREGRPSKICSSGSQGFVCIFVIDAVLSRNRYDDGRKFEFMGMVRKMNERRRLPFLLTAILAVSVIVALKFERFRAHGQEDEEKQNRPWMNTTLSPDERADLVLKEMTLDEKIDLVHGNGMPGWGKPRPNAYLGNGGGGVVVGGWRLGESIMRNMGCWSRVRERGCDGGGCGGAAL